MTDTQKPQSAPCPPGDDDAAVRMVEASELLAGQRELIIVHEGAVYRLRLTRRNKLILQK